MKTIKTTLLSIGLAMAAMPLIAATTSLTAASSSKLWLEGNSTLHAFSSTATLLSVDMALDRLGNETFEAAINAGQAARLTLKVPVAGLKSHSSGLDKNLRSTLKADEFPQIAFTLESYKPAGDKVAAAGALSIAGKTRPVTLELSVKDKGGRLIVEGVQPLLMTDFGVKPPKMMLGAVKTDDKVVVKFHLELEQAAEKLKDKINKEDGI